MTATTEPTEAPAPAGAALVLGASGGIGAAVVAALAAEGRPTAVGYHSGRDRAQRVVRDIEERGGVASLAEGDVTTEVGVLAAFDAAERLGPLEVVVCCVGGWGYTRLAELTVEEMDQAYALNLRSALLVLREGARRVVEDGRIVLVSSASVDVAPARQATYAAAKAGLEAAARVAAKELAPRRITVNVVRPGATDTETLRASTSVKAIEAMANANAMRRLGTPQDIADVVLLLCAPRARWVTGVILDATGGLR